MSWSMWPWYLGNNLGSFLRGGGSFEFWWRLGTECFEKGDLMVYEGFYNEILWVVCQGVVFLKSPCLLQLELIFKICTSLSGKRFVASYMKGQRLWSAIQKGQVFLLEWNYEKVWKILLAFCETITCSIWSFMIELWVLKWRRAYCSHF